MNSDDRIGEFFQYQEEVLKGYIDNLRRIIEHGPSKGVELEEIIRTFFISFIPGKFNCSTGFLIDSDRNLSSQTDIIIYDSMNVPSFFNYGTFNVLPVEAVSVVAEVKTTLNKKELTDCFEKFKRIEEMKFITENKMFLNGSALQYSQTSRPNKWIISYTSKWSKDENLKKNIKEIYDKYPELDHVKILILDRGILGFFSHQEDKECELAYLSPRDQSGEKTGVILASFLYKIVLPNLFQKEIGSQFWINYIPKGYTEIEYIN